MNELGQNFEEVAEAARRRWPDLFPQDGGLSAGLAREAAARAKPARERPFRARMAPIIEDDGADAAMARDPAMVKEVVLKHACPVFRVVNGEVDLKEAKAGQQTWFKKIEEVRDRIAPALRGVGRIEVDRTGRDAEPMGTGWLIDDDVVVTNGHVAEYFAEYGGGGLRFRPQVAFDRPMTARLDVGDDATRPGSMGAAIRNILFLSTQEDFDLALLRLESDRGRGWPQLELDRGPIDGRRDVAVIGYPEEDDRADPAEVERLFGKVWGWKRFAPGLLGQVSAGVIRHLCNTLGGNSGSPLIDLESGKVIGLHYGGLLDRGNYALPVAAVADVYERLKAAPARRREMPRDPPRTVEVPMSKITIPLVLSIELQLGDRPDAGADTTVRVAGPGDPPAPDLGAAVEEARALLAGREDVIHVRPGWRVRDGWITDEEAVVVAVERKVPPDTLEAIGRTTIPSRIAGYPMDVTVASPADVLAKIGGGVLTEATRRSTYKPRPELLPRLVRAPMQVLIQPGPDAGPGMLRNFLSETTDRLTVGMYEFTAPHVVESVLEALGRDKSMAMVLQKGESLLGEVKSQDLTDEQTVDFLERELGERFTNQWASVGSDKVFPWAYHIKVAVRDDEATWMSSGSWQSSNQPAESPEKNPQLLESHNREFHVVIQNRRIATLYREHIERDAEEAAESLEAPPGGDILFWVPDDPTTAVMDEAPVRRRYFEPLRLDREVAVQPLLTPENFAANLLPLIREARSSILFQNQSFDIINDPAHEFRALLDALLAKQRDENVVVKIILRGEYVRDKLERMKTYGFKVDRSHVRVQDRCHNKMWIFDGRHTVIGSHNFTSSGTTRNRDASLLFRDDEEIARYCADVFDYDWRRVHATRLTEASRAARMVRLREAPPPGMRAVRLSELGLV